MIINKTIFLLIDHPDFLYDLLEKYDCVPTYYDIPDLESPNNNNNMTTIQN